MKIKILIPTFLIIFTFFSCDVVSSDLEKKGENPLDPQSPNYSPPKVSIVEGPSKGETIKSDQTKIKWEGNQGYLNEYKYRIDTEEWSGWVDKNQIYYTYLNERLHTFEVKTRYLDQPEYIETLSINFKVDAIQGPSLWIRDKKKNVQQNFSFDIQIIGEEVDDLAMVSIELNFHPDYLEIVECSPTAQSPLLQNHEIIHTDKWDNEQGYLKAYLSIKSEQKSALKGSGALFNVKFESINSGNTTIAFGDSCEFRNYNDEQIMINETNKGIIEIEQ